MRSIHREKLLIIMIYFVVSKLLLGSFVEEHDNSSFGVERTLTVLPVFFCPLLVHVSDFTLCFRIAKSQHYDSEGLIDIFRQYGDHLYTKGDHNAAIEQYIKTIGKLEPSYVIRKVHLSLLLV
jgi:hypothetical protein